MRILQVSTSDEGGGAARAALRLQRGLRDAGHDSTMRVLSRLSRDPHVVPLRRPGTPLAHARHLLRQASDPERRLKAAVRRHAIDGFSTDRSIWGTLLARQLDTDVDVVNLHWVSGFVDWETVLAPLAGRVPLVWTMHDQNPFTGGCHYAMGCDRFTDRCGRCPQLGSEREDDASRRTWLRKRRVLERMRPEDLHLVSPSRWLAGEARRSSLFGRFPTHVIPYGLDLSIFRPIDRGAARAALGLPPDAEVVLFVAASLRNPRKGFPLLVEALEALRVRRPGVMLLSVGESEPMAGQRHLCIGTVTNERMLPVVYAAADVFAIPSLRDNLPNTILESMACGVPVVGFDAGGQSDAITPGVTGELAPAGDIAALAAALERLLGDDDRRRRMADAAADDARTRFGSATQAAAYAALYRQLLDGRE